MSADHVTRPEFEIYRDSQKAMTENLKELVVEVKKTNTLLKDDITQTHKILQTHISQYNTDKALTNKEMADIKEKTTLVANIVSDREDVYRAGKTIKWAVLVVVTGALGALGAQILGAA